MEGLSDNEGVLVLLEREIARVGFDDDDDDVVLVGVWVVRGVEFGFVALMAIFVLHIGK